MTLDQALCGRCVQRMDDVDATPAQRNTYVLHARCALRLLALVLAPILLFILPVPDGIAREAKAESRRHGNMHGTKGKGIARPVIQGKPASTRKAPTSLRRVLTGKQRTRARVAIRKNVGQKRARKALPRRALRAENRLGTIGLQAGGTLRARAWTQSLRFGSRAVYVVDELSSKELHDKDADLVMPIASLTKLMTALIVIDAKQDMREMIEVTHGDIDRLKHSASRLAVGSRLSRDDMLHIALMSSENRAASALARHYPGGISVFIAAMNVKARELGMTRTKFVEPTGLSSENVASARDLAKLTVAADSYPLIARYSTDARYTVRTGKRSLRYVNSNPLIGRSGWDIGLQKTGYTTEAGRCLVMKVTVNQRPLVMVFLNSDGHRTRFADARRLREWALDTARQSNTAGQVNAKPDHG